MRRRILLAATALFALAPLGLQAQDGLQMRVDRSTNAADPDDVPEVTVAAADNGFQVNTGPAAVLWDPNQTASGTYTLSATFHLVQPSDHANYYGLVFGGSGLEGADQQYLYFLVAQNGTYLVKQRDGDATTNDIQGRTASVAVQQPDGSGTSVNELEVRVGASDITFAINGTVVHTAAKSGMAAVTDGIYGVRVNHRIPGVIVEGLGTS